MSIRDRAAELTGALAATARPLDPDEIEVLRTLRGAIESQLLHEPGRCDPLTGLSDRARYDERLAGERRQRSLCVFELESPAGADVLCAVARILQQVRDGDVAFRIGEREFALLLPGTPLVGARVVGERIADRIATEAEVSAAYGAADSAAGDPRGLHAAAVGDLAARRRRSLAGAL